AAPDAADGVGRRGRGEAQLVQGQLAEDQLLSYSVRSASTGFSAVARRAGRAAAASAATATSAVEAATVAPSIEPTPKSWLSTSRPGAHTLGRPIAMPPITIAAVSRTMSHSAAPREAPRAIRMPISRVRRETTN